MNGWYHGGEQLEEVVSHVMRDVEHRHIDFPRFTDLKTSLRSTLDGSAFRMEESKGQTLAHWVIRHLLVCHVDWSMVSRQITSSMEKLLESDPTLQFTVLSFGPSSDSLTAELTGTSFSSNLQVLDLSAFQTEKCISRAINSQDVAIVGMGVNYPMGKDPEELWATLSKGLSAVSEVRTIPRQHTQSCHSGGGVVLGFRPPQTVLLKLCTVKRIDG